MLWIPCSVFSEGINSTIPKIINNSLECSIENKDIKKVSKKEVKRPQSGSIEVTGNLGSEYVRIELEITSSDFLSGNIYKSNGESVYVYGKWSTDGWLELYDRVGTQYRILPSDFK
jgi:hypothetical protein